MLAGDGPRMLEIVARYSDAWNTAWHADPTTVPAELDRIRAACEQVQRDPSTLAVTAAVAVAYPDLGQRPWQGKFLSGDAGAMADALHGYAHFGIAHVIVEVAPFTQAALDRFAEALQRFRGVDYARS